jgi:hypothetical protein
MMTVNLLNDSRRYSAANACKCKLRQSALIAQTIQACGKLVKPSSVEAVVTKPEIGRPKSGRKMGAEKFAD